MEEGGAVAKTSVQVVRSEAFPLEHTASSVEKWEKNIISFSNFYGEDGM